MSDAPQRRFRLRPLEAADFETVSQWFQDVQDLALFDRALRVPLNRAQTEEIWKDAVGGMQNVGKCWFVIETDQAKPVGLAGLEAISNTNRDAVIPLFVDKSVRRCGVGIRAAALTLDFAFRQLGLHRITSYYREDNHSTRDLVGQLGCKVEGTMRQAWFADAKYHNMVVVGLLQQEWMVRREELIKELSPETTVAFGDATSGDWCWPPRSA
ncbi:MAG: GNAT family N-acetyltransferase [Ruegeria sp.]|uniref:GNAT family N-acetyltransferase n=1 Tax=Ruegeria sp. ANG-S4 TaxID=1577904 RepID=UPI00057EF99E|nr:GNAT family protein [Ruegeria sp. ANG-S4]KIC41038.1 GNAT family acetyltransferase [Ruegeria sp. ANG-S4]